MSLSEELLMLCQAHNVFVQIHQGRVLVAFGGIVVVGSSLPDAIEKWCRCVEQKGLVS